MEINEDYSCENRGYLFKDCCIQGVSHHHLHWAGTQSWGEEWKSFIVKKGEAWVFLWRKLTGNSVQFSPSVMSDVCNPMDCSTPGFPVHHQLPELAQTHVHQVGDAIQPSHPLSSPSLPTFNLSQHQGFFKWVNSLHQVAKVSASASVLPMNIQDWFPLG